MNRKGNFLAICLLDALEDGNIKVAEELILKHGANPNTVVIDRGIAPIHYACGMENDYADQIVELMLEKGGNPNIASEDNMTPLHVAAVWGRSNIVRMLLDKGANLNVVDDEMKTPFLYALYECHFDVVKIFQNYVFQNKSNEEKPLVISANKIIGQNNLSIENSSEKKSNPPKMNLNLKKISSNYISIKQTKTAFMNQLSEKCPEADSNQSSDQENLCELTEDNLAEYSKNMSPNVLKVSFVKSWRDKVQRSKIRKVMVNKFNDVDALLHGVMTDDSVNFTNTIFNPSGIEEVKEDKPKKFDMTGFGKLLQRLREEAKAQESEESFFTADNKSPERKREQIILQLEEEYVHTDDENGLMFYEKRFLPKPPTQEEQDMNVTYSTISTDFTVPLDYDTEALRRELTNLGNPPGPITKSTKQLYIKRLIKYKQDPSAMCNLRGAEAENHPTFSMELEKTVRNKVWYERIPEYMELEAQVSSEFQKSGHINKRWREGHLKTSFIYLLIDPRISDNLPRQSMYMDKHDVWKKFLSSIFYVGKGKSIRPYSHLYDAMKIFSRQNKEELQIVKAESKRENQNGKLDKKGNLKFSTTTLSKKLERILEIWRSGKGVVCLHVFHNILPAEAYTREAAIIDALSMQHLTNLKRGDYYGCSKTWNMRTRKNLGTALLFKAMQIFLAEGESQLLPSDLI